MRYRVALVCSFIIWTVLYINVVFYIQPSSWLNLFAVIILALLGYNQGCERIWKLRLLLEDEEIKEVQAELYHFILAPYTKIMVNENNTATVKLSL